jgi:hypothetical protein
VTAIATLWLLAGCAPAPLTSLPRGVTVQVLQYRSDYGPRMLEISVTNAGSRPLTVTRAAFVSSHFEAPAVWKRPTEVPQGLTRDLKVQLAKTRCAATASIPDAVVVSFTLADGRVGTGTVTPTDPFDSIKTITAQDCLDDLTLKQVTLSLPDSLRTVERDGHPVAIVDLRLTPTGASGAVTVDSIGGTILMHPSSSENWAVGETFDATAAPRTVALDFEPNNCRFHTVAEDKRGTFFPVTVTTADGSTGVFYLTSSNALREAIYTYVAEYCGW